MKKTSKHTVYRKKKATKQSRARVRRIKKLLLFILLVTGVIIFARSSFFIVGEIKVVGSNKYKSKDVIERTGLVTGHNDSEQSIYKSMPYIKTVSIRPALPKSISIKIQDRTPFAILENKGTSLLIDREGYVLEIVKGAELKNKYFKIMGTSVDSFDLGQVVKFKNRSPLELLTSFCDILLKDDKTSKVKLYGKITSVRVSELNRLVVDFDNRITVKFGDLEDVGYNIRFFKQLFVNNIIKKVNINKV